MKPIPAQNAPTPENPGDGIPGPLTPGPGNFSAANRRANHTGANRTYPLLLVASTLSTIFFCLLYINKPITNGKNDPPKPEATAIPPQAPDHSLIPDRTLPPRNTLPSRSDSQLPSPRPKSTPASAPMHSIFEETNLRVQHILTAEDPGGHVNRIDIDVPVLYQSRNLRWTAAEVSAARSLMLRLMEYQDKTRQLKSEGQELLSAWSKLMNQSIPSAQLRADSPSLPGNQEEATKTSGSAGTTGTSAIQLKATE